MKKRGLYLAICVAFLFPFTPYVMYSQLLCTRATWRWGIWICLIYNGVWAVGILATFFPETHTKRKVSAMEVLRKIDYVGAFTSISGITLL